MYGKLHKAGQGGFADDDYYWSSSEVEYYNNDAWRQSFSNGHQSDNYRDYIGRVRPVRAF